MKELSIEEKAKRYDEVVARLRHAFNSNRCTLGFMNEILRYPKESEDEKIRKALIEYFNEQCDMSDWNGVYGYQVVAWLEKQGEHKKFRDSIQVGDEVTRNRDGVIVNLSQLNRVAKKDEKQSETYTKRDIDDAYVEGMAFAKNELEKQGEQKTALSEEELTDFEKSLKHVMEETLECGDIHNLKADADLLLRLVKPTDEDMKEALRTEYEKGRADAFSEMQKEWSDKEKQMYADIIEATKKSGVFKEAYKRELVDWLKSLRPQNTWKPSDEQMRALDSTAGIVGILTPTGVTLCSLYQDLEKLKGE